MDEYLANTIENSINAAIRNNDAIAIWQILNALDQYYHFLENVYDAAENDENLITVLKDILSGGGYFG